MTCFFTSLGSRILWFFTISFLILGQMACSTAPSPAHGPHLLVNGAVENSLELTRDDLGSMAQMSVKDVMLIREKQACTDPEALMSGGTYKGVLLRDILLKAGMTHVRKWEPGVFIRVIGRDGKSVVFSFGEIFYSSIGRSVMVALEFRGKPIKTDTGRLIVTTDVRAGRHIENPAQILVERVDLPLEAYEDKKADRIRPASQTCTIQDMTSGKTTVLDRKTLETLPDIFIPSAVMAGDCEGFRGIHSFKGPGLRQVLEWFTGPANANCRTDYTRYILVASQDGFCAVFSMGELFNSRLGNNIVIAHQKNGRPLGPEDGFAMSVAGEDNLGGRSVRRIETIRIF